MPDLMQITSADELCEHAVYAVHANIGHSAWFWTYARSPEYNIHIICAGIRIREPWCLGQTSDWYLFSFIAED
jgi:hypothetical protein